MNYKILINSFLICALCFCACSESIVENNESIFDSSFEPQVSSRMNDCLDIDFAIDDIDANGDPCPDILVTLNGFESPEGCNCQITNLSFTLIAFTSSSSFEIPFYITSKPLETTGLQLVPDPVNVNHHFDYHINQNDLDDFVYNEEGIISSFTLINQNSFGGTYRLWVCASAEFECEDSCCEDLNLNKCLMSNPLGCN